MHPDYETFACVDLTNLKDLLDCESALDRICIYGISFRVLRTSVRCIFSNEPTDRLRYAIEPICCQIPCNLATAVDLTKVVLLLLLLLQLRPVAYLVRWTMRNYLFAECAQHLYY
jgi:hypothetical protein